MSRNRSVPRARAPTGSGAPGGARRATTRLGASVAMLGAVFAPGAIPAEFECAIPGDRRHLRMELPGESHLCEVSVSYRETGERRVMWYADQASAFCSDRLEELRARYEDDWGFDCTAWPDPSGVGALDPVRRAALDDEIRRRRSALVGEERLVGVRVARAPSEPDASLNATEFFVRGADGEVRTALVLERDGRSLAGTEDLAASLSSDDVPIRDAWVDSIGVDGTVRIATETADDPSCRGRQTLRADADGALVPSTPHRFACDVVQASGDDAIR